jgi:hypothetical protein
MNRVMLALAAGLLGGALSHYVTPTTMLAQAQSTAPKEIRAQRFTLVNEHGAVLGVFGIDKSTEVEGLKQGGEPTLRLFDETGREIFRAGPPSNRLIGQKQ